MRKVVAMIASIVFLLMLVVSPISGQAATIEPVSAALPNLTYRSHVQNIGWMANVSAGELSGTTGRSLRMEALVINMQNQNAIEYRARVRGVGWQNFVRGGQVAGTTGRSLPIEAIEIRLTGTAAQEFDIQYQVHMANIGWLGWVQNGVTAGAVGVAPEVQAIRIRLVPRAGSAPGGGDPSVPGVSTPNINYSTHVQNIGWQASVRNGAMSGTSGRSLRLEGIRINISDTELSGGVEYRTHVQDIGWQGFVSNGAVSGTTGRSLRLEAIQIRLTGQLANNFDVYYRVHVQDHGWLDWASNGQSAGSAARSLRLEGIEIRLVARGSNVNRPQNTNRPFVTLAARTGTRGLWVLESQLWTLTNRFPGQQSVYVRNLNTGEYTVINNAVRHNPASLMKLFVVGAAHEQIALGRMQMTPQVRRWMTETITISTNDSYNWLLFHIGQGCVRRGLNQVTNFARRQGYSSTIGGHSFNVHPQPGQVVVAGGNRTTARDVGLFMEDVYRGNVVNRSASAQIMESLRGQRRLNKIPAGLPAGVRSASKTGEWAGYEHDAAIVFSRGATYVIVVMSTPGANSIQNIRTISNHVYRFFN